MGKLWRAIRSPITAAVLAFIISFAAIARLIGPETCRDGWASPSIGIRGACSHHGGVERTGGLVIFLSLIPAAFVWAWVSGKKDEEERRKAVKKDEEERRKAAETHEKILADAKAMGISCPTCGYPMRKRIAKKGRNRGKQFWGCSRYPGCKGARDLRSDEV